MYTHLYKCVQTLSLSNSLYYIDLKICTKIGPGKRVCVGSPVSQRKILKHNINQKTTANRKTINLKTQNKEKEKSR